jgi:hypothetical protein
LLPPTLPPLLNEIEAEPLSLVLMNEMRWPSVVGVTKSFDTQFKPKWRIILLHPHGIFETLPSFIVVQIEALPLFVAVDTVFGLHFDGSGVTHHAAYSRLPLKD